MFSFGQPHHYYSHQGARRPVESLIDDLDAMLLGAHPIFHALSQHKRQEKFWHHKVILHGYEPDDIKLTVDDDSNKIKIHARHENIRGEDSDIFESIRNVSIPEDVDVKKVKSRLHDNGVLVLQAPFIIKEEPPKETGKELQVMREEKKDVENSGNQQKIPVVEKESETDEMAVAADASDKEYSLSVNMHSFSPEDINVTLKGNALVVKAEKKEEGDGMNLSQYYVSEYSLPPNVDTEKLNCVKMTNGQLVVSAPYQLEEKEEMAD